MGWFFDIGNAAFETFRAFPKDAEWNAARTAAIHVPLTVAVGEEFALARLLPAFIEGYKAMRITEIAGETVPGAAHCLVTYHPDAVAELIERKAGSDAR